MAGVGLALESGSGLEWGLEWGLELVWELALAVQ